MTDDSSGKIRGLGRDMRDMAVVSTRVAAYNFGYLALAWVVGLGAIAAFHAFPRWYTFVIAFIVVSSRQQALLNCEHEAVHYKFPHPRRWNDLIGRFLCAAPVGSPFEAARARHLAHHRLLGTPEDPDRDLHMGESLRTRRGLTWHFVGGMLGGYETMILMGPRLPRNSSSPGSTRRDFASLIVTQGVIAAALTLTTAWWVYPALWLAPLASLTVLCHLVRNFVEHAITDTEEPVHGNRMITITSNWIERSLVAPYFMNYHAEHHLLPSVPAPRLKELQKRLADRDDAPAVLIRSSYSRAIRQYMRALPD